MKVSELIKYLKGLDGNLECYTSVWTSKGERKQAVRLYRQDGNVSKDGKYVRISWTDDCNADDLTNVVK